MSWLPSIALFALCILLAWVMDDLFFKAALLYIMLLLVDRREQ